MELKTECDKKHANKHQVKEDQTHMPLPPEGTSHAMLLVDITSGKKQACVKVLRLHMAMARKQVNTHLKTHM